ncbi:hypothetical protein AAVH_38573, partial [Aphelenchoides avenae]
GGRLCAPKEELVDLAVNAREKDPALAYHALYLLTMDNKLKAKLESTSDPAEKERLATLLEGIKLQLDEAMYRIVVIAGGSKQGGSKGAERRFRPHERGVGP